MKGPEETGQAPAGSANQFQVLPPEPATQTEAGMRLQQVGGISAAVVYVDTNRANAVIDDVTNVYAINGTIHYQGVESTLSALLFKQLLVQLGGQWMHAVQHAPSAIDGLTPENTPRFTGNATVPYRFGSFLEGLPLIRRALHTGAGEIKPPHHVS